MKMREFGSDGEVLPLLGLGCSKIGSFGNSTPMSEVRRLLVRAVELGVLLFDTADVYGQGDSEREVGRLVRARPEKLFVVTKVGKRFSAKARMLRPLKPVIKAALAMRAGGASGVTARREEHLQVDYSPAHIVRAVDASLRRLRMERIDALLLHSPQAAAIADPRVGETLLQLKIAGKVRHFGVSCDDMAALEAAVTLPGLTILEVPLDVIDGLRETAVGERVRHERIAVLAREVIRHQPSLPPLEAVRAAAQRDLVTTVIAGTTKITHLEDMVSALARAE